jgi:hypothetical protein
MKIKVVAFLFLAVLLAMVATPVYADSAPALPHAFYGAVEINGSPAPVGTSVKVMGEGVQTGVGTNPIETTVEGEYGGGTDPMAPKLVVQGSVADGTLVTFYVNGFSTGQTAQWHSGELTEVNLSATIEDGAIPDEPDDSTPPDTGGSTPPDTGDSTPPDTGGSTPPDTGDSTPPDTGGSTPPDTGGSPPDATAPGPPLPPPPPSAGSGGVSVLWLIIGGVVLVGLIIAFWVARSRAY